eukprot:gnl/Trimastix_PCT/1162.p1 GENE.gnl/Trimastix_PCT/1162~~gnl/Trimastix_PCT/1162.p1  ORF type:complete len:503 (-),score=185.04 gnl/Trimastix_PCT/1162:68-1576(-)
MMTLPPVTASHVTLAQAMSSSSEDSFSESEAESGPISDAQEAQSDNESSFLSDSDLESEGEEERGKTRAKGKEDEESDDDDEETPTRTPLTISALQSPDDEDPLLVQLPHGCAFENSGDMLSFSVSKKDMKNARRQIVKGENSFMEVQARNWGGMGLGARSSSYMLGVMNRKTRRLELVPVPHIYALKQRIKGEDDAIKDLDEKLRVEELTLRFGSKVRKQTRQKRIAYSLEDKTISTQSSGMSVEALATQTAQQQQESGGAEELDEQAVAGVPPHDMEAVHPVNAYPIDRLIPPAIRETLPYLPLINLASNPEILAERAKSNQHSHFVMEHIARLPSRPEEEQEDAARLLCYITYLWRFYHCHNGLIARGAKAVQQHIGAPAPVVKHLLNTFAVRVHTTADLQVSYSLPPRSATKIVLHLVTVALHVDKFETNPQSLAIDLNMALTNQGILRYYRALGCKIVLRRSMVQGVEKSREHVVTLPVPLKFPNKTFGKKKQRRGG